MKNSETTTEHINKKADAKNKAISLYLLPSHKVICFL